MVVVNNNDGSDNKDNDDYNDGDDNDDDDHQLITNKQDKPNNVPNNMPSKLSVSAFIRFVEHQIDQIKPR